MKKQAKYVVTKDGNDVRKDELYGHFFDIKLMNGPKEKPGQPLITVFVSETEDVKKARRVAGQLAAQLNRRLKRRRIFRASRRNHRG